MQKVSKYFYLVLLLSILPIFVILPTANADFVPPEIISVKANRVDVYVGKKWNKATFQVEVKDQSLSIKSSKSILKSTDTKSKDIVCNDGGTIEKAVSGDFFQHVLYVNCVLPRETAAPEVRYINFTVTDLNGLSSSYTTDIFDARVNFIYGFDPKLIEKAQTDTGKLRLVEECTSYEQVRLSTLDIHKTVAKFPAGNPFETKFKEGKTALAKPFN